MPRNGSGTYTVSVNFTTESGSPPIEISKLDSALADIGSALTASLASDGQTSPSANLPMNGKKHTNVAAATALTEYARVSELIDQDHIYYVDSGAADAYVITPSPAIAAYEEGQRFVFRSTNTNTGASTLNVNSLGTRAIQTSDGSALTAGAIISGGIYEVTYDANTSPDRWVLTSPASNVPDGSLSSNVPLKDTANTFTASGSSGALIVSAAVPAIRLSESDGAEDNKNYVFQANGEQLLFSIYDDDISGASHWLSLQRTGTTVDSVNIAATAVTANSKTILTETTVAALTNVTAADLAATDSFYVNDAGSGKQIDVQDFGSRIIASATQTLARADANAVHVNTTSSDHTVTVPPNSSVAFPIGTEMVFVCQSTGNIILAEGSGVTIHSLASALTVNASGGGAYLVKTATNTWSLIGNLE